MPGLEVAHRDLGHPAAFAVVPVDLDALLGQEVFDLGAVFADHVAALDIAPVGFAEALELFRGGAELGESVQESGERRAWCS